MWRNRGRQESRGDRRELRISLTKRSVFCVGAEPGTQRGVSREDGEKEGVREGIRYVDTESGKRWKTATTWSACLSSRSQRGAYTPERYVGSVKRSKTEIGKRETTNLSSLVTSLGAFQRNACL